MHPRKKKQMSCLHPYLPIVASPLQRSLSSAPKIASVDELFDCTCHSIPLLISCLIMHSWFLLVVTRLNYFYEFKWSNLLRHKITFLISWPPHFVLSLHALMPVLTVWILSFQIYLFFKHSRIWEREILLSWQFLLWYVIFLGSPNMKMLSTHLSTLIILNFIFLVITVGPSHCPHSHLPA